jgi:hypothetical protein
VASAQQFSPARDSVLPYIEVRRPVRARTAALLDLRLARSCEAEDRARVDLGMPARSKEVCTTQLTVSGRVFSKTGSLPWEGVRKVRNPAWWDQSHFMVYCDTSGAKVRMVGFKFPRRLPWTKTVLPALRAVIRREEMSDSGLFRGSCSTNEFMEEVYWLRFKMPRYEWRRGRFVRSKTQTCA